MTIILSVLHVVVLLLFIRYVYIYIVICPLVIFISVLLTYVEISFTVRNNTGILVTFSFLMFFFPVSQVILIKFSSY